MKKILTYLILVISLMTMITSCKPDKVVILPTLGQSNINNITKTSAIISGNVTNDGGGTITSRGVYISATGEPSSADRTIYSGNGLGVFDCFIDNLEPNTNYRAKVFATNEAGTSTGLTIAFMTKVDSIVIATKATSNITMTTAISGGVITEFGSNIIAERGVVYKVTKLPTIMDNKIVYNGNEADYTCLIANLQANTKYYVKAYATSSKGETYYGEEICIWTYALIDQDNNGYHAVTIGTQTWTVENFKATHYRNGDEIPEVTDNIAWSELTTGARCYYNNDRSGYEPTYGCMYNWYTITDNRGLAPTGWHVSTDAEWTILKSYLGDSPGGKMKETGTTHWKEPNVGATNSSGFTALPGGGRGNILNANGVFLDITTDAVFWSSTPAPAGAWGKFVSYNYDYLFNDQAFNKSYGFSVRLVKD